MDANAESVCDDPSSNEQNNCTPINQSLLNLFANYATAQQPSNNSHSSTEIIESAQSIVRKKFNHLHPILLACNGDVNYTDSRGQTILHIFVMHYTDKRIFPRNDPSKDLKIVEILLKNGASTDIIDMTNNTPVHYAACNRRADLVEPMLKRLTNVTVKNNYGCSILHYLVDDYSEKPSDLVLKLIRDLTCRGADIFELQMEDLTASSAYRVAINRCVIRILDVFKLKTKFHNNVLLEICQNAANWAHHPEELQSLSRVVDLDQAVHIRDQTVYPRRPILTVWINEPDPDAQNKCLYTALHYAAKYGRIEAAEIFLDAGADIDATIHDDVTPLHLALLEGQLDMVRYLIGRGANLKAKDSMYQFGLMHMAVFKGNERLIDLLLEAGLNINERGINDLTPLHLAALGDKWHLLRCLISRGAEVNCRTRVEQWTPVHMIFAGSGDVYTIGKRLYDRRIDGAVRPCFLNLARNKSSYKTNVERINCIVLLLQVGANANARDNQLRTPLHMATSSGNIDVIEIMTLLENGARVDVQDRRNRSPLNNVLTEDREHLRGLQELIEHGANIEDIRKLPKRLGDIESFDLLRYLRCVHAMGLPMGLDDSSRSRIAASADYEVTRLMKYYLLMDGETSLYDFLHMDARSRSRFVESAMSCDLKRMPFCQLVVENSCRSAVDYMSILNDAKSSLNRVAGIHIPDVCAEMILGFMSKSDMTTFVDIMKSFD